MTTMQPQHHQPNPLPAYPNPAQPPANHAPRFPAQAPVPYPQQYPQPHHEVGAKADRSWLLGLVSVAAVVLGLSVDEDGANQWAHVNAWGGLAVVAAVLTLAPVLGRTVGVTAARARQAAAVGAGALVLFWVLFTLPVVGSNTSLVTTIGVGAGAAAAALSRP